MQSTCEHVKLGWRLADMVSLRTRCPGKIFKSEFMRGIWKTRYRFRELMVLVTITCVLLSLLPPAIREIREIRAEAQRANELKYIRLAQHRYHLGFHAIPPVKGITMEKE